MTVGMLSSFATTPASAFKGFLSQAHKANRKSGNSPGSKAREICEPTIRGFGSYTSLNQLKPHPTFLLSELQQVRQACADAIAFWKWVTLAIRRGLLGIASGEVAGASPEISDDCLHGPSKEPLKELTTNIH